MRRSSRAADRSRRTWKKNLTPRQCVSVVCADDISGDGSNAGPDPSGGEVLTRGPLHEAFAESVSCDGEQGETVQQTPPEEDVAEEQPAKPEGPHRWIKGYWAWDKDRNDFIWVSGVWRLTPPSMTWIEGSWVRTARGFQWVCGYWAPNDSSEERAVESESLPPLPLGEKADPVGVAPSDRYFWVPGYYKPSGPRSFVWCPGHWECTQPDWVWIPARYVSVPRGFIFVPGHWDYDLGLRGVVYCPVHFAAAHPGRYTPAIRVDVATLRFHLFCCPTERRYYFGDYFDRRYEQKGIYPWFEVQKQGRGYEPLFVHDTHDPATKPRLEEYQKHYVDCVAQIKPRPPQTLVETTKQMAAQKPGATGKTTPPRQIPVTAAQQRSGGGAGEKPKGIPQVATGGRSTGETKGNPPLPVQPNPVRDPRVVPAGGTEPRPTKPLEINQPRHQETKPPTGSTTKPAKPAVRDVTSTRDKTAQGNGGDSGPKEVAPPRATSAPGSQPSRGSGSPSNPEPARATPPSPAPAAPAASTNASKGDRSTKGDKKQ